jgi:hypothetical protein
MSNKPELILPDSKGGLVRSGGTWKQAKPFLFAISLVTLLGIILAGLQQFFSFRGVVHTLASRIALGIVLLAGILFVYIATRPIAKKRNTWFLVLAVAGIAFAWFLDWWATVSTSALKSLLSCRKESGDMLQHPLELFLRRVFAVERKCP